MLDLMYITEANACFLSQSPNLLQAMRFLLAFASIWGLGYSATYVPGEKGAPWSLEEAMVVKAKLLSSMDMDGAWGNMWQVYRDVQGQHGFGGEDMPAESKFVRLGFHDCLKYEDGTGGCDGCLNWEGVGWRQKTSAQDTYSLPDVGKTNNNGLRATVELLEEIYTNTDFPYDRAPYLAVSLKESGKSRADLWAFAALVAVEYAMETNNMVCDGTYIDHANPERYQCHHSLGTPECLVDMKKLTFKTGRRDCKPSAPLVDGRKPYMADKHEDHPNAVGNGDQTSAFFARSFNFTGREMVTIMGAHTLGRFHYSMSLFRYVWTSMGTRMFNNHYYKSVAGEDRVAFNDPDCNPLTAADGSVPKTRWINHVHRNTIHGGPLHWIHENKRCPNCLQQNRTIRQQWGSEDWEWDRCCVNLELGQACKPECEQWRFIVGRDEMAIPSEMGLYYDFEVDDVGLPYGSQCPGYNPKIWGFDAIKRGIGHAIPDCPKNTKEVAGSPPLHEIFEEYAHDQAKWVDEFVPTYEKMLENGVNSGDLEEGPDINSVSSEVKCTPRTVTSQRANELGIPYVAYWYNCWKDNFPADLDSLPQFTLVNRYQKMVADGKWGKCKRGKCADKEPLPNAAPRVIESDKYGHAKMMSPDPANPKQRWVELDDGIIVNVGTRMPLGAGGGRSWTFTGQRDFKFLEMSHRSGGPKAKGYGVYCGRQMADGERCYARRIGSFDPALQWYKMPVLHM